MALDPKKLAKKLNVVTPEALREAGLDRLPVEPDGELDEALVTEFATEGKPEVDYYKGRKVMTPEQWDAYRRDTKVPEHDPISGRLLPDDDRKRWAALAPVRVLGGAVVSQADLAAYGSVKNLLHPELTSYFLLRHGEKGETPLDSCPDLEAAALAWPYDKRAQDIARTQRFTAPSGKSSAPAPVYREPEPRRMREVIPEAPARTPGVSRQTRETQLEDFILGAFSADEAERKLFRAVERDVPGASSTSPRNYVSAAVGAMNRRGLINRDFFDAMILANPGRGNEITTLRGLWGC